MANYRLIAGLGNPGREYELTRHNIGFLVVDHLAGKLGIEASAWKTKHKSLVAQCRRGDETLLLVKPQTFMNLSGEAVRAVLDFHQVPLERVLIIADDVALPFGTCKVRPSGSDGGHNGLTSIAAHLGTNYARLRCGISGANQAELKGYVLGRFGSEERQCLPALLEELCACVFMTLDSGVEKASNRYNRRDLLGKNEVKKDTP